MNTQIKQIAERLQGLRDALNLTIEQTAEKCGISAENYIRFESGNDDIPMSFLFQVAQNFGIEITALIAGEDPHSASYFVTRKGKGIRVERRKSYKYQTLASGFKHAKAEPFEVTIQPNEKSIQLNTHEGQEFNFVIEGDMQMRIGENNITLSQGDSIYFDATKAHGMKALNGKKVTFLAIIIS